MTSYTPILSQNSDFDVASWLPPSRLSVKVVVANPIQLCLLRVCLDLLPEESSFSPLRIDDDDAQSWSGRATQ